MPGTKNRARLLHLIEILHRETDEEHSLSLNEIKARLEFTLHDDVSLKAITDDLSFLGQRRRVLQTTIAHGEKRYSMPRSEFELYELRILIDAVAAARSITQRETKRLIGKIKTLTSRHMGSRLESQLHLDTRTKATNERLKYYLNDIHEAIIGQKKIAFQYAKYTPTLERKLLRQGQDYVVCPYGLIWNNDYYYVVGRHDEESKVKVFRLDRMERVAITGEHFRRPDFSVVDFVNETFNMYSGANLSEIVELEFDNRLVNVVTDRFGPKITLRSVNDNAFRIRIKANISDGLVRWILNWGKDAKVIAPQSLVDRIRSEAAQMLARYSE